MRPTALILAGGQATRLGGIDKRALVIDGQTIFDRQVRVLAPRTTEIIVSTPHEIAGYRCVRDAQAGVGPLAGVYAGLCAAQTDWLLVVAGDMPFISGALVDRVCDAMVEARDAVGLRVAGRPEPLFCALRCATSRPVLERRLARAQHKASALLCDDGLITIWLEEPELRAIDPELRFLFNVNTPEDARDPR